MTYFQSLILGIVQGLTEFLPISSSGHLVIIPKLFNWSEHTLVFDTTLHLGTSLALIVFFFDDIKAIILDILYDINASISSNFKQFSLRENSLLGLKLLIGCIPAILLGFIFGDYLELVFRDIFWVALFLSIGSVLMYFAEYYSPKLQSITLKKLSFVQALFIGLFQSLALFPGMSRSGSTISGGMIFGLNKEDSAKFSFLLSIPIILGVGIYQLVSNPLDISNIGSLVTGFLSSFILGLFAIKFLLKFLKTNKLYPFVIYRFILAFLLFLYIL